MKYRTLPQPVHSNVNGQQLRTLEVTLDVILEVTLDIQPFVAHPLLSFLS